VPGRGAALRPTSLGGGGQLVGYPDWWAARQPGTDSTNGLSPEEEERQRRELQRVFGVTPEDVARAQ